MEASGIKAKSEPGGLLETCDPSRLLILQILAGREGPSGVRARGEASRRDRQARCKSRYRRGIGPRTHDRGVAGRRRPDLVFGHARPARSRTEIAVDPGWKRRHRPFL